MPHINANGRRPRMAWKPAAAAILVLLLAAVGLAACGGSSSNSTTTTTASAAAPTSTGTGTSATGAGATGASASRLEALRTCLQKNGITLPKLTPGQSLPGAGAAQLPAGVTRAQYEATVKKCGGAASVGAGRRIKSPVVEQALKKYAACMRENGVNLPAPNTSGSGPVFNAKGLDTTSPQFRRAESKCSADLQDAFRHP